MALALLMAQFAGRSWLTHRVFNDTADEEVHIACGLEVWQRRAYTIEPQHPPLARVVLAALPYLAGLRLENNLTDWNRHPEEFYWRTLSLARLGNLIFLPLLLICVFRWGRDLHGPAAGLGAATLTAFCPNLLAHASLATLDFAAATLLTTAAYALWRWSREPRQWAPAAVASGLAVLTKFSAVFFLPVLGAAFFTLARRTPGWSRLARFTVLGALLVWAGYGFSVGRLLTPGFPPPLPGIEAALERLTLPAPAFFRGVLDVLGHNAQGHQAYLLGQVATQGWWYYFPVALAVKTALPLLFLAAVGGSLCPALGAALLLGISMLSNLNLGIRHLLAIYPLFALMACPGFARPRPRLALLLVAWHLVESLAAHPDYLPYFNQTVRGRPERYLLDSALDWGQDLERLRRYLRNQQVTSVYLSYFGRGDPIRRRIPGAVPLGPNDRPAGWVAVSRAHLVGLALPGYNYGWLLAHQPRARIGQSILVYYFPQPAAMRNGGSLRKPPARRKGPPPPG